MWVDASPKQTLESGTDLENELEKTELSYENTYLSKINLSSLKFKFS